MATIEYPLEISPTFIEGLINYLSRHTLTTQQNGHKGEPRYVAFSGWSTTKANTLNFRIRYYDPTLKKESWTTKQVTL